MSGSAWPLFQPPKLQPEAASKWICSSVPSATSPTSCEALSTTPSTAKTTPRKNSFSGIVKVFYNVLYIGTPDAVRMLFNRAKHAMLYLRPGLVGFRAGMLARFLYGCKKDRRTKELVTLFAIWVASYMLNSLVAYADQIETKGKRVKFGEAFAALPDQFTIEQLREALIEMGCKTPSRQVAFRWIQNLLVEKVDKGIYRKVKKAD